MNFARHLETHAIDHFGIGRTGPKAAPFWLAPSGYRFHQLHIGRQLAAVMAVLDTERPDVIVNYAAQGEGAASFTTNAPDFFDTNATALVRLVVELRNRSYLQRFIQIGTSELYGSTEAPAKETDPYRPSSPYAISKAAFDQYLVSMHKNFAFPMNIVRPSNCYTEGQQLYRVIPKAILCALSGRKLPLQGGGKAQKSYLHATDLSSAVMAVIGDAEAGKIYNVAPSAPVSIAALIWHVAESCGVSFEELVEVVPDRIGQDAKYWLDASAIRDDIGWKPVIPLGTGIDGMVRWVKKYPELLQATTEYQHKP